MTTQVQQELERANLALARQDFEAFVEFCWVGDPPPRGEGIVKFQYWPHLKDCYQRFQEYRRIVWLKSRQVGASWFADCYGVWTAMFSPGAVVLLISQGEDESRALLSKLKLVYDHLPQQLQVPITAESTQRIAFSNNSIILALPSTSKAGRSYTGTLIIIDEADQHEYLESNLAAITPTLGDSGGQLILLSTSNPDNGDSPFKQTYRQAKEGTDGLLTMSSGVGANNYHAIFYGWKSRPGRDLEWYESQKSEAQDISRFEKEHPNDDIEALRPPRTISAFNHDVLDTLYSSCRTPMETMDLGLTTANIWQKLLPGKKYLAFTDTSHGTGNDDSVTVLLDTLTGVTVADIVDSSLPPEELAGVTAELLSHYGYPTWAIEDNDWGRSVISAAQSLKYPNLYFQEDDTPGFHTGSTTRFAFWSEYIKAVHAYQITCLSEYGLQQHYTIVKNPRKQSRVEGASGTKDDYVLSLAGAWYLRRHARVSRTPRQPGNMETRVRKAARRMVDNW